MEPLASRIRPSTMDEVIGQEQILGKGKLLSSMIKSGKLMNMIFYGPPGTGKTTVARLLAEYTDLKFVSLNASVDSLKDVREAVESADTLMGYSGIILYIDEIHMMNKRNQQVLLDYIEDGRVILVGATTENPHFAVFRALVSRCIIVEFKPLSSSDIKKGILNGVKLLEAENGLEKLSIEPDLLSYLSEMAGGDMRGALSRLEVLFISVFHGGEKELKLKKSEAEDILGVRIMDFDTDGDVHFDILSAFHKSVRGSDPDAALIYMAMMLKGGDLISISRRLLAIASEDIGLAHPTAVTVVKACVDSALQLGLPEAKLPIAQATIFLATAPKSNSAYLAINAAMEALDSKNPGEIPPFLRDSHYTGAKSLGRGIGYKYPHTYKNHWVSQEYMPSGYRGMKFYEPSDNKLEKLSEEYWNAVKGEKNEGK